MKGNYNILVTGASRGIGHAISKMMSKYADTLILTSKESSSMKKGIMEIEKIYRKSTCLLY